MSGTSKSGSSRRSVKIVVSDLHMGSGYRKPDGYENPNEDFHYDHEFVNLLDYYSTGEYAKVEVELIFNGDTFEMFETSEYPHDPLELTNATSMKRLARIIEGHPVLFEGLSRFLDYKKNSVRFITGNHDYQLLNSSFQARIKKRIGSRVHFTDRIYYVDGVHIEHGNQYIPVTAQNFDTHYVISPDTGEEVSNLSFGALFSMQLIYKYKFLASFYPLHRVFPMGKAIRQIFIEKPLFGVRYVFDIIAFFFRAFFFYKRRFQFPEENQCGKIFKSLELDMRKTLERKAAELLAQKECSTVVFGHTHHARMQFLGPGKTYINTGSWIDEVDLSMFRPGTWTILSYAYIEWTGRKFPIVELKEWKGLASPDRVIMSSRYY